MAVGGNGSRYSTGASIENGGLLSVEGAGALGLSGPGLAEPGLGSPYGVKYDDPDQTIRQLQTALETRVVIEQAKGVLAERFRLSIEDAFRLLRDSARTGRMPLRTSCPDGRRAFRLHAGGDRCIAGAARALAVTRR